MFPENFSGSSTLQSARSTVSPERQELSPLPASSSGGSDLDGGLSASVESSGLASSRSASSQLSVLHGRVAHPVDSGVVSDGLVHRVNHDDLEPLVHGILGHPVTVEDAEGAQLTSNSLFGDGSQVSGVFPGGDTVGGGFTVTDTLGDLALSGSPLDADTVDNISLLGLVSQTTSLIGSGRSGGTVDGRKLPVLPSADTQ